MKPQAFRAAKSILIPLQITKWIAVCSLAIVGLAVVASAQTETTAPDTDRVDAIFRAARDGDLDTLKQLIGDGSVDVKMPDGATPLFDAAMNGRINVLAWLLEKGANVNSALPDGTTALHLAIANSQPEACRTLLKHGANVNAAIRKPDSRITPLLLAIDRKGKDMALLLIEGGADVNAPLGRGYVPDYPLEQAAWPDPDTWPGQEDVIKALVAKGATSPWLSRIKEFDPHSLNALTPEKRPGGEVMVGSSPLVVGMVPARRDGALPPGYHVRQVLRVINSQNGRNFWRWGNPQKDNGPLTVAIVVDERDNKTELRLVPTIFVGDSGIAYSENISDVERDGPFADITVEASENTVRVTAVRGSGKVIELTRSGNVFRTTLGGVTDYEPISVTMYGHGGVTQSTTEFGCVYRAAKSGAVIYHVLPATNLGTLPVFWGEIHDAAKNGDLAKVRALLQADPGLVFKKDSYGGTPLHWAAINGHKEVAELLLENKAVVDVRASDGATPLISAVIFGHKDVAGLLLANGADVNARTNDGLTPLHAAADKGYEEIAELLVANRADVNAKDNIGLTPLHYAAGYGHKDVAEFLLAHGADINARNFQNATPLRLADFKGQKEIAEFLRLHGGTY